MPNKRINLSRFARRLSVRTLAIPLDRVAIHHERGHTHRMSDAAFDYDSIPVPDRIRLVEDIWDSIASSPEQVPVTDAQRAELDRRREAYAVEPRSPVDWMDAKARITDRLRSCR